MSISSETFCAKTVYPQKNEEEQNSNQDQIFIEEVNPLEDTEFEEEKSLISKDDNDKDFQEGIKDAFSQDNGDKFQLKTE